MPTTTADRYHKILLTEQELQMILYCVASAVSAFQDETSVQLSKKEDYKNYCSLIGTLRNWTRRCYDH
jgi:hypothetical protein